MCYDSNNKAVKLKHLLKSVSVDLLEQFSSQWYSRSEKTAFQRHVIRVKPN